MTAVLWIVATLVTEWALKTIWHEYVEPFFVARSHAKAAADRAEEAEELTFFGLFSGILSEAAAERNLRKIQERQAAIDLRADQ